MCLLYKLLTYIAYPFLYIYYKKYSNESDEFIEQSFVLYKQSPFIFNPDKKILWMHGVSIGEVLSAVNFSFFMAHKGFDIFFSVKTKGAYDILKSKGLNVVYIPFDIPCLVRKFLNIFNPSLVMFFESEVWPNTISAIKKAHKPLYLINARISQRSFNRWKFFRRTFRKILLKFNIIISQTPMDSVRFKYFSPNNVMYVGNLKYATEKIELEEKFGPRIMIVAASTHIGEEEIVLEAYNRLIELFGKSILLVLVPRHITRVQSDILPIMKKYSFDFQIHSTAKKIKDSTDIYIVDTFGELNNFYKKSRISFIGGSLVNNIGGHNIFEAAIRKNVIIHGPFMANQMEMKILFKDCSFEISNADELYITLKKLICDRDLTEELASITLKIALDSNKHVIREAMQLINKNFFQ